MSCYREFISGLDCWLLQEAHWDAYELALPLPVRVREHGVEVMAVAVSLQSDVLEEFRRDRDLREVLYATNVES